MKNIIPFWYLKMTSFFQIVSIELPYIIICILLIFFWISTIVSLWVFYRLLEYIDIQNYFNMRLLNKQITLDAELQEMKQFLINKKTS
jgi:hypothetical protein